MSNAVDVANLDPRPPIEYRTGDAELLELTRSTVRKEILRLERELAAAAPARGAAAAGGLERLARKLRLLRQLARELASALPRDLSADAAGLGSLLTLKDCVTGEFVEYTLMSGDDIDIAGGQVSLASAIGCAVSGARAGTRVEVALPRGVRTFRLVELTTLPVALGIVPGEGSTAASGPHKRLAPRRRTGRPPARGARRGSTAW